MNNVNNYKEIMASAFYIPIQYDVMCFISKNWKFLIIEKLYLYKYN